MSFLMQVLSTGLLQGLIYALIGIGLYLVFSVMRIVNFAHGFFVLIGMYGVLWAAPNSFFGFIFVALTGALGPPPFGWVDELQTTKPTLNNQAQPTPATPTR